MPELEIQIGGRGFTVACQDGEEPYLEAAARMLDVEASAVVGQVGRMPEPRMLLMAGLMLADKTAGFEEDIARAQERIAELEAAQAEAEARLADRARRIADLQEGGAASAIPEDFERQLEDLALQAEALADSFGPQD